MQKIYRAFVFAVLAAAVVSVAAAAGPGAVSGLRTHDHTSAAQGGTLPASGSAWVLLETNTASSSASLSMSGMSATYDDYVLVFTNFLPATNDVQLLVQFNGDTAANYGYYNSTQGGTRNSDTATACELSYRVSNTVNAGGVGVMLQLPGLTTAKYKKASYVAAYNAWTGAADTTGKADGGCLWRSTSAVTSLVAKWSSGNIVTGSLRLYAMKKS